MSTKRVATFFYGSYIDRSVLAEVDLVPERFEVAQLRGYDISIAPLANLVESPDDTVYGVVAGATHDELERLYTHARDVLGGTYLPHPVFVSSASRPVEAALCYIAPSLDGSPPDERYVRRILDSARDLGFPTAYRRRLERFLPSRVGQEG